MLSSDVERDPKLPVLPFPGKDFGLPELRGSGRSWPTVTEPESVTAQPGPAGFPRAEGTHVPCPAL